MSRQYHAVFSDGFGSGGDGTECFAGSTVTNNTTTNMAMTANPRVNNGSGEPQDGEYSVLCTDSDPFSGFWLWHNDFTDHSGIADGNVVVINDGDNNDFYKKNITGLCVGGTYTVTFYLANLADVDVGGGCITGLLPNISASAYNAGTTTGTTTNYGTTAMTAKSNFTWVAYSFSFTAVQSSMDIVLSDLTGAGCGNDIVFDDFSVVGPPITTPVELISFTGGKLSQSALLKWSTASEKNSAYFSIEKSLDGQHFIELGTVNTQGNSNSQINYEYIDYHFNETSYYRLKMIDIDGSYEYSTIVVLREDKESASVSISEGGKLKIKAVVDEEAEWNIAVYSLLGPEYINEKVSLKKGENSILKEISGGESAKILRVTREDGVVILSEVIVW
jgi:hypothetical protein